MLCVRTSFYFHTGENKHLSLYKIVVLSDLHMYVLYVIHTVALLYIVFFKARGVHKTFLKINFLGVTNDNVNYNVFFFDRLNKKIFTTNYNINRHNVIFK